MITSCWRWPTEEGPVPSLWPARGSLWWRLAFTKNCAFNQQTSGEHGNIWNKNWDLSMGYDQQCLGLKIWKWLIRHLMAFFTRKLMINHWIWGYILIFTHKVWPALNGDISWFNLSHLVVSMCFQLYFFIRDCGLYGLSSMFEGVALNQQSIRNVHGGYLQCHKKHAKHCGDMLKMRFNFSLYTL